MAPLIVLLTVFIITLILFRFTAKKNDLFSAGRIAMSAMLVFTAIGHFVYTEGMAMMLPDFIPYAKEMIYFTGGLEIAAAAGLLIPRLQRVTAWLLIIFFIQILPANIYAAIHQVDYQQGTLEGAGPEYLWFRVPLQLFFILWVYFFILYPIRNRNKKSFSQVFP